MAVEEDVICAIGGLFGDQPNSFGDPHVPFEYILPPSRRSSCGASRRDTKEQESTSGEDRSISHDDDESSCHPTGARARLSSVSDPSSSSSSPREKLLLTLPSSSVGLMAHYVWQSSLCMADLIAEGSLIDIAGKTVIELGAGAALPSIMSAREGARLVLATDYPEESIVRNMKANLERNLSATERRRCRVVGHKWGTDIQPLLNLLNDARERKQEQDQDERVRKECLEKFMSSLQITEKTKETTTPASATAGSPLLIASAAERCSDTAGDALLPGVGFDVILLADTLWLKDQHEALAASCFKLLKRPSSATCENESLRGRSQNGAEHAGDGGVIYLTFQHHNPHAPSFFTLCKSRYNFAVREVLALGWGGREAHEFDLDDPECVGPVYLYEMRLPE